MSPHMRDALHSSARGGLTLAALVAILWGSALYPTPTIDAPAHGTVRLYVVDDDPAPAPVKTLP